MAEPAHDITDEQQTEADSLRHVSERGPFAIWENPKLRPTFPPEAIDVNKAADGFEYGELAEEYGEEPVRRKIGEMIQSYGHGTSTTPLFSQPGSRLVRPQPAPVPAQPSALWRLPLLRRGG